MTREGSPLSAVSSEELKKRIEESLLGQRFGRGRWVRLVEGKNELRLLGVYREVMTHYLRVTEDGEFVGRRFNCPGQGCPLCIQAQRAEEKGEAALAQNFAPKPRYTWMCIDLRDSENADGSLKVKLFEHGPALLEELKAAQEDVESGISDLAQGYVVIVRKVQRSARKMDVRYRVRLGVPMPITQEELAGADLPDLEAICAPTPVADIKEALSAGKQGKGEDGTPRSALRGIARELGIGNG